MLAGSNATECRSLIPPASSAASYPHRLEPLLSSTDFLWATGIEDTFITAPWPATGRILDEYELTGHYRHWEADLELMGRLGVRTARYGVPWYRINPAPGEWQWGSADGPLQRLLDLGINPIVDLVHYGLPSWIEGAYLHPQLPDYMAAYAGRLAERFHGRLQWYTPLNEPRITAWYCGRLGWWPPFLRGWRGFVAVMLGLCRGIVLTHQRLREIDPEMVLVHVDAADVYSTEDPVLAAETERRQQIGFLGLDLVTGRVNPDHPLWDWLLRNGAGEADLEWFREHTVTPDLIGLNTYPMFSQKRLMRKGEKIRIRNTYGSGAMLERLCQLYWVRYGLPLMISETAARGKRRSAWLHESVEGVRRTRARGIPLVGYTWWPMFALVAWAYRQGRERLEEYLEQMGLWNLEPGPDGDLRRVETPLVAAYRALTAAGASAAGPLAAGSPVQR